ncbi:hypothetical protein CAEBREN_01365 [Caenorhabditis brenneri]|uniref:SPK domain-containing protein n=1 Tax=Caenorhabditis brenneri TaxID=135651 RepID=G0NSX7_CAEBE|nr:hypothetical protein CAEBREN_01365 [Caenorhabditis brenneri]
MKDRVSDTIKIYRWIIRHKWDVTSPTPVDVLLDGCNKYKDKYVDVYRKVTKNSVRWNLKHHLKKPETVLGFTNEQKVHLMFVLSLPVNEAFETILKNEGSLIELTDPERLITFFRSRDGTFERRATYTLDLDGNVSADIQQNDDPDSQEQPIKKKYQKLGRPKTVFPSIRTTDPLRMLHWLGKHCEYITTPVSASIVCQCWLAKKSETKSRKRTIQSTVRNQLKSTMKNPELLAGFTTEQKVQLLFILSLPMNESFQNLVKHEGHEIELTDPERLITYFRSRDGTIERKATLQLHHGIYEPPVVQLDDDDDNFNYEDMEIKQYYDPGAVIKEEPMDEFDPQRVFVKEEPIDDYYDSMDASLERDQQYLKEEPMELPEPGPSSVQRIKQEPGEQPAPRVVPSICRSLRILRASVMALRSPGLAGTQKSIEETLEVHRSDTNPVPITDIAVNLSSIIYLAMKGDPKNDQEEQISRKVYLQFLLQFVILLNSNDLNKFQKDLEQKIDQLDDAAKIRLENVKNGLSALLVAITA